MDRPKRSRTLRRLAAVGAVAALGGGLTTIAHAEDTAPQRAVKIQPGELDRGPKAAVPHTIGRSIFADGERIRTGLEQLPNLEARSPQGFIVSTLAPRTGTARLWNIHRDGSKTFLGKLPRNWQAIEVSTDGTRVAYAWARGGDVKVAVRLTRSGRKLDTTTFASRSTELVGFGKRRPLMTRWRNPATFWYSPATGDRERIADKQAWRVDVKRNRISLAIPVDQGGYDGYCLRYAKLSTPRHELWYSCKQKPVAWSGDGRKVLTTNIAADGLGPSSFQIRRTGGTLLRTFRAAEVFGSARFEGADAVLFTAQGPRTAALVRCDRGGDYERASALRRAHNWGPNRATRMSLLP